MITSRYPRLLLLLVGSALAAFAQTNTGFTAVDFSGNPWSSASTYAYEHANSTTEATSTLLKGAYGTIDSAGGTTPSPGLRLEASGAGVTGNWGAALTSGKIAPPIYRTTDPSLMTLSFMLKASSARPVRVRLESYSSSGDRTGRADTLVFPAAPDFWQRYAIELSELTPFDGTFNPSDHRIQLVLEIGSNATAGAWPFEAGHWLQLDNVHLAGPAYYVSPAGSDSADGRSPGTAFATVQKALNEAQPSDIVLLMDGQHTSSSDTSPVARFRRPGTPAAWIVVKNHPGHTPVLRARGWQGLLIRSGDPDNLAAWGTPALAYLEVRGLTIRGYSDTYSDTNKPSDPAANVDGIQISGRYHQHLPHHIRIADNHIYQCTGAGIATIQTDWIWVEDNVVHDNSRWTIHATSGISLYQTTNYDGTSGGYRNLVRGNRSFRNETKVVWQKTGEISDGNGIIIDDSHNSQNRTTDKYPRAVCTGRFLVAQNISYLNGGSGMHAFSSDRVDFVHNTLWHNSASPALEYYSMSANDSSDVRMINNIVVSAPGEPRAGSQNGSANVVITGNVFSGGTGSILEEGVISKTHNLYTDPLLSAPALGDFRLLSGSPALGSARDTDLGGAQGAFLTSRDRGAWDEVVPLLAASPYADWVKLRGLAAFGPLADPDRDGLPNFLEYALATEPLVGSHAPAYRVFHDTARLALAFTRHRAELRYEVLASSDLATWSTVATNPGELGAEVTVLDPAPDSSPSRFLRLQVAAIP